MTHTVNPRPEMLRDTGPDPRAERYWSELESALMASTIAGTSDLPPDRRKALLRLWAHGTFNATAYGLKTGFSGTGTLQWDEGRSAHARKGVGHERDERAIAQAHDARCVEAFATLSRKPCHPKGPLD